MIAPCTPGRTCAVSCNVASRRPRALRTATSLVSSIQVTRVGTLQPTPRSCTRGRRPLSAYCEHNRFAAPASNREVAEALVLSVDAAKTHLKVLFEKFDLADVPRAHKRAELARRALDWGLVSSRDLRCRRRVAEPYGHHQATRRGAAQRQARATRRAQQANTQEPAQAHTDRARQGGQRGATGRRAHPKGA